MESQGCSEGKLGKDTVIILIHIKLPVLTSWPTCCVRWSRLMYKESQGVIETMKRLQVSGIPALPVHDSLIVPAAAQGVTEKTVLEVFKGRFGVDFKVNVSQKS
jgi:hypothetical protein